MSKAEAKAPRNSSCDILHAVEDMDVDEKGPVAGPVVVAGQTGSLGLAGAGSGTASTATAAATPPATPARASAAAGEEKGPEVAAEAEEEVWRVSGTAGDW